MGTVTHNDGITGFNYEMITCRWEGKSFIDIPETAVMASLGGRPVAAARSVSPMCLACALTSQLSLSSVTSHDGPLVT